MSAEVEHEFSGSLDVGDEHDHVFDVQNSVGLKAGFGLADDFTEFFDGDCVVAEAGFDDVEGV